MSTPAWLHAAALLLWGFAAGQGVAGVLLALVRIAVPGSGVRLNLTDRDLNRAVDVSAVVVVLMLAGCIVAQGLPKGLLSATGWLPAVLFPLLLIDSLNETPPRLRHLVMTLRRSSRPEAGAQADLSAPYLAITLLAAGITAKPSPWFFWALVAVTVSWLFQTRPSPRTARATGFIIAAILAVACGYGASVGLDRMQGMLQDWVVNNMFQADPDPHQTLTRIGDIGRVKRSEQILWRVEQTPPATVPLLLRGGVYTRYANGAWITRQEVPSPLSVLPGQEVPALTLHGQSHKGVAVLPVPIDSEIIDGVSGSLERNAYGVVRISNAPPVLEIRVSRSSASALVGPETGDLSLPPSFGDLLKELPQIAALRQRSKRERLTGVESWFAEHFRYTLFLGDKESGGRDLKRFLLKDRAGHCEYFATSTVLLLRTLGIPARYVTGYSVQEYSRLERAFVVRQRHAHAWAEAFVDGKWVEVDTTPSEWLTVEEDAAPFWRPASDLVSFAVRRFSELRRDMAASEYPTTALLIGALLAVVLGWLAFKRPRSGRTLGRDRAGIAGQAKDEPGEEMRSFLDLEHELEMRGLGRRPGEPPRAWIARVSREGSPVISQHRAALASDLIEALYRNRYGSR